MKGKKAGIVKDPSFTTLFFKFEASHGFRFRLILNFPEDDDYQRRKALLNSEQLSSTGLRN
jgi:hypothetical protein